jgi:phosphoglucomutase
MENNSNVSFQRFEEWKDKARYGEAIAAELAALTWPSIEIEDRFYQHLSFGTAGLRGILGAGTNRMNEFTVARAATGYAKYLMSLGPGVMQRGVAISYDSRARSAEFAEIAARIFVTHGIKVYLSDTLRPVPMLSFAIRKYDCSGGVMITASHNPKAYNGFKAYGEDGSQLPPEGAAIVSAEMDKIVDMPEALASALPLEKAKASSLWQELSHELDEAYIEMLLKMAYNKDAVARQKDLKIVYTPLHGAGNVPVRTVLDRLGFQKVLVVAEQEKPDPDFSTVAVPNPELPETLSMAIELAKAEGADLVIGTDPDGDRCGVAVRDNDQFKLLAGNEIGLLLLDYILETKKQRDMLPERSFAVTTIVSSRLTGTIAEHFGVDLYTTLTGFKFIGELIKDLDEFGEQHFQFGFEESFGYLAGTEVRDKDAVVASMLLSEMAAVEADHGRTLKDRLHRLYEKYGYAAERTVAYELAGKVGLERIAGAMQHLRDHKEDGLPGFEVKAVRDYLTGEHLDLVPDANPPIDVPSSNVLLYELGGRDYICVRPSGTEPKLKVYLNFYGDKEQTKEKLAAALVSLDKTMHTLLEA